MKIILSILLILISTKDCKQNSAHSKSSSDAISKDLKINYEAFSRGYFKSISFENSKLIFSNDINREKIDTLAISQNEWNELVTMVNLIDVKSLENLKAPTDKRLYDAAPHCTLSVTTEKLIYTTPSFDEGFPPQEIKSLVNKMLSIYENHLEH